jgi:PAS domain S-box-containing protein
MTSSMRLPISRTSWTLAALRPYAVAAAGVAACIPIAAWLGVVSHGPPPVMVLLVAVAFAAWQGGRGPAFLATALSVVIAHVFFANDGAARGLAADETRFLLMTIVAISIALLAGSLHAARAAQRVETARLRSFIEHLPAGFVVFDAQGRVVHSNQRAHEILGFPDLSGLRRTWSVFDPEGRAIAPEDLATSRALRGERTVARPMRYVRPDGADAWLEVSSVPIHEGGSIAGALTMTLDVTERYNAQAKLSAAERRLEIALEAARMGRWHLDLATGHMDCSATCKANFGRLPHEKFDYDDVVATVHPDDRASMQQAVRRAIEERREYATEYRVVWPDGTVRWIAVRGRATFDEQGHARVMDGVTIDFTGRKRLEQELRETTLLLQDADRRKDQFLAVLGHELRNPLAPMRNAMMLMRMQGGDEGVRANALAVMERQMTQLMGLVDELLDVSRIAQGKVRLERQAVPLAHLVRDAAEAADPLMRKRRHAFHVVQPPGDVVLHVDRVRIVQVLTNLLNNAAKYTADQGEIELGAEVAGGVVAITVRDNGMGIAPESQAKIFDLFSQVDASLHRAEGGLGLGLNVARRLVEMHDGAITVHSEGIGRGSIFTVTLPVASRAAQETGARSLDPA